MLIQNLQTAENNGVVTANFTSGACKVKVQVELDKVVDYRYSQELKKYHVDFMSETDFERVYKYVKSFVLETLEMSTEDYITFNLNSEVA